MCVSVFTGRLSLPYVDCVGFSEFPFVCMGAFDGPDDEQLVVVTIAFIDCGWSLDWARSSDPSHCWFGFRRPSSTVHSSAIESVLAAIDCVLL